MHTLDRERKVLVNVYASAQIIGWKVFIYEPRVSLALLCVYGVPGQGWYSESLCMKQQRSKLTKLALELS